MEEQETVTLTRETATHLLMAGYAAFALGMSGAASMQALVPHLWGLAMALNEVEAVWLGAESQKRDDPLTK